jgi:hypothetical protein
MVPGGDNMNSPCSRAGENKKEIFPDARSILEKAKTIHASE